LSVLRGRSRRWIALTGVVLLLGALVPALVSLAVAQAASSPAQSVAQAGSPAQPGGPTAVGQGKMTPAGVGVARGNLRTTPFVKPFLPASMSPAAYQAAKAAAATIAAPSRSGVGPSVVLHPPAVRGSRTNRNGTNFANSAGSGVSCNCAPPDVDFAVGRTRVVEVVNKNVDVYTKGTSTSAPSLVKRTSLRSFFGLSSTERITDPRVVYDNIWNRWIIVLTRRSASSSDTVHRFFLAVSTSSNPAGSYFKYRVTFNLGPTPDGDWLDFPGLGFDQDAIAITGVMFDTPTGGDKGSIIIGIPKARAYNGLGFSFGFPVFDTGVIQPNIVLDQNHRMFLTAARDDLDQIQVFACTDLEKPGATSCSLTAGVGVGFDMLVPPNASQPGSTVPIDTLDARFENRGYQSGNSVWQVHTINESNLPTPRFYQIDTATNTLTQQGDFFTSTISNSQDYNASIAANRIGEAFVTWNVSNASSFIRIRFSGRHLSDAAGSMNSPGIGLFTSTRTYTLATTGEPPRRWGDYSGTALDPQSYSSTCGSQRRAWVANEKVETNGTWGSRFGRIGYC
jgi:hypothetical protein